MSQTAAMPQPEAGRLLQPGDPQPFEIINKDGAGRVILIADHAGRAFPRSLGTLGLSQAELARHIAWDIGIGEVTRRLSRHLDAPALLAGYSRLVIDCNRAPGQSHLHRPGERRHAGARQSRPIAGRAQAPRE